MVQIKSPMNSRSVFFCSAPQTLQCFAIGVPSSSENVPPRGFVRLLAVISLCQNPEVVEGVAAALGKGNDMVDLMNRGIEFRSGFLFKLSDHPSAHLRWNVPGSAWRSRHHDHAGENAGNQTDQRIYVLLFAEFYAEEAHQNVGSFPAKKNPELVPQGIASLIQAANEQDGADNDGNGDDKLTLHSHPFLNKFKALNSVPTIPVVSIGATHAEAA